MLRSNVIPQGKVPDPDHIWPDWVKVVRVCCPTNASDPTTVAVKDDGKLNEWQKSGVGVGVGVGVEVGSGVESGVGQFFTC